MKKKDDIDNKYELAAFVIKHWWKAAILILLTGIVVTGFKCNFFGQSIEKTPIYRYQKVETGKLPGAN